MPRPVRALCRFVPGAVVLVVALLLAGCATDRPSAAFRVIDERACLRATTSRAHSVSTDEPAPEKPSRTDAPPAGFSPEAVEIADAIGVLPLLRRVSLLEANVDARESDAQLRLLRLRLQINDRILRAMLEVSSVLGQVDCEGERIDQLKDYLQAREDKRVRPLTLLGITLGAATAIVSGGLSLSAPDSVWPNIAEIAGGSLGAAIGLSALPRAVGHQFSHKGSLLREVWEGPEQPRLFPRSVWRFLNQMPVTGRDSGSPRQALIARWFQGEQFGVHGSDVERQRIALLFGDGGWYTVDDLQVREALLDLLEATVALMSQDLESLLTEVIRRTGDDPE